MFMPFSTNLESYVIKVTMVKEHEGRHLVRKIQVLIKKAEDVQTSKRIRGQVEIKDSEVTTNFDEELVITKYCPRRPFELRDKQVLCPV